MKNHKGFTLIELLIAMTLTVTILTILFSALRFSYRSQEKGIEREEISQKMRILSHRLTWLIKGAYPYIVKKEDSSILYFKGNGDSIGFVTTSIDKYSEDSLVDISGLKWIRLYVDSEGLKMRENIYFPEENLEGGEGKEYVFDPDVRSCSFEYLDTGKEDKKPYWVSEWSSKDKDYLPSAVRVKLTLQHRGKEIEIPPIVAQIRSTALLK